MHSGHGVTVVVGNAGNRYRVQTSDGLSSTLVVQRLVDRLRDRSKRCVGTSVGPHHLQLVQQRIEAHCAARREVEGITVGAKGKSARIVARFTRFSFEGRTRSGC